MNTFAEKRPLDAQTTWIERWPFPATRPYLRLARADRPIGVWLLLWPCWWSVLLSGGSGSLLYDLWLLILFAVGAVVMRSAGCAYNDIIDRDYDGKVERTKNRPIPNGDLTVKQAALFMLGCCIVGLVVLLQFNLFSIFLGICSLGIVAIYPFMKRITFWPQAVLGLAFSWGALMGWASVMGELSPAAVALYVATVFWIIGYDTIYAHQDKEDDALLGLKSTALRFGETTKFWLSGFYSIVILMLVIASILVEGQFHLGTVFVLATGVHLAWQVVTLDIYDTQNCLTRFRSNRDFGALVCVSLLVPYFIS